jgi:hypothetical protein
MSAAAHLDDQLVFLVLGAAMNDRSNLLKEVLSNPVHYEPVGGEQTQGLLLLNSLQWADPGVEMLLGKIALEPLYTPIPKRSGHFLDSPGKI